MDVEENPKEEKNGSRQNAIEPPDGGVRVSATYSKFCYTPTCNIFYNICTGMVGDVCLLSLQWSCSWPQQCLWSHLCTAGGTTGR